MENGRKKYEAAVENARDEFIVQELVAMLTSFGRMMRIGCGAALFTLAVIVACVVAGLWRLIR